MKKIMHFAFIASFLFLLSACGCKHEWEEATCTEPKTCTKCGEIEGEPLGHNWTEATCTEPKTCSRCGETDGEPLGHDVLKWTVTEESTCSKAGVESGECTRCHETITSPLKKKEHTPGEWEITKEPTSSSEGERSQKCTVCGETIKTEKFTMSEEELKQQYINKCGYYSYNDIARNPDSYYGEYAQFTGEVIQVMEGKGNEIQLRVNITRGSYYWSDTILVSYERKSSSESRILEDDIITMYGQLGGMYTYTSVMGAEVTVPLFFAEYIDIQ